MNNIGFLLGCLTNLPQELPTIMSNVRLNGKLASRNANRFHDWNPGSGSW
jgi:hypothetical protein